MKLKASFSKNKIIILTSLFTLISAVYADENSHKKLVGSVTKGSFSVGVEINNYTFKPLNVNDLTSSAFMLSVNNNHNPVNPSNYNSHGLMILLNPLNNKISGVSYSYFNTGSNNKIPNDYVYFRNCMLKTCPSVHLDLKNKSLSFVNTELQVDNSPETISRPNVTNKATIPAKINGSIRW